MKHIGFGLMIILVVTGLAGCMSANVAPLMRKNVANIDGSAIPGLLLLQADGTPYAGVYRAAHGVVVCGNFNINALEKAGVAAAIAGHWGTNGLVAELDATIVKANGLAAAMGVKPGMTVRDALTLLNRKQNKK